MDALTFEIVFVCGDKEFVFVDERGELPQVRIDPGEYRVMIREFPQIRWLLSYDGNQKQITLAGVGRLQAGSVSFTDGSCERGWELLLNEEAAHGEQ